MEGTSKNFLKFFSFFIKLIIFKGRNRAKIYEIFGQNEGDPFD